MIPTNIATKLNILGGQMDRFIKNYIHEPTGYQNMIRLHVYDWKEQIRGLEMESRGVDRLYSEGEGI